MIQKNQMIAGMDRKMLTNALYVGLTVVALSVLGWFAYQTYTTSRGRKTQRILSEGLQELQTTMNSYKPHWADIQLMGELGAQQVSDAHIRPFFLAIQAQAFSQQQKYEEAAARIQEAHDLLPANSPYKSYFALTHVLMQLDVPAQKDAGFAALQALAQDAAYPYQDAALYYVGEYYQAVGNDTEAKNMWQQLTADTAAFAGSPWVLLAQQKLMTV